MASIEVVLPTYNGVAYLEQQLISIDQQSLRPSRVLVRDDGSIDGTQLLISLLKERYGAWLEVLPSDGNLGCVQNVHRLIQFTKAGYVALADQDDIWLPHRLATSMMLMEKIERKCGSSKPLLVHSDLNLVNVDGISLGCTYFQNQRLDPRRTQLLDLALTNVVTGSTVLLNRALINAALPIPQQALMHDWWLALVASCTGEIGLISEPTVNYRQHPGNVVGARGVDPLALLQKLSMRRDQRPWALLGGLLRQFHHLQHRYPVSPHPLPSLLSEPRWRRFYSWLMAGPIRPGLTKHGPLRTLGFWVVLLLMPMQRSRC